MLVGCGDLGLFAVGFVAVGMVFVDLLVVCCCDFLL